MKVTRDQLASLGQACEEEALDLLEAAMADEPSTRWAALLRPVNDEEFMLEVVEETRLIELFKIDQQLTDEDFLIVVWDGGQQILVKVICKPKVPITLGELLSRPSKF